MSTTTPRNSLRRADELRLFTWLSAQHAMGNLNRKSFVAVARLATNALDFRVTWKNVQTLARDAELDWPRPPAGPTGGTARIAALERTLEAQQELIAELEKRVARVEYAARFAGVEPHPALVVTQ